jgi:selenocysteine lyase/cysteine desulfurase
MTPPEVLAFRAQFPALATHVHLASNSMGAISQAFIEAHRRYLDERIAHGANWHLGMQAHEQLRSAFARLIGARPHEIGICFAATQALGVLASGLSWRERPAVVFDDYSFPSTTYLWHAQRQRGAQVRRVHPDALGNIDPEHFDALLDDAVAIASVAHVCYKNGHRVDLAAIAQRVHEVGAWLCVDDYQSCGTRRMDVRATGIDILTTGTVKFLLGSPGVAFLYVREELLERLHPTVTGWFGQLDPNDFQVERHIEAPDAARFQNGTPSFSSIYESLAGIELIQSVGLARIESWIERLTTEAMRRLLERGFVLATPQDAARRSALLAIKARDAERAVRGLAERRIITSSRDGNVRAAWHYYNTLEDIDTLIGALEELAPLFARA